VSGKLNNAKFIDNAPEAVVAKEREKEKQMSTTLAAYQQKLEQLADL